MVTRMQHKLEIIRAVIVRSCLTGPGRFVHRSSSGGNVYCVAANDSFRRQIDSPGAPIASKPSVAGSEGDDGRDSGFGRRLLSLISFSPVVSPVKIALFGIVSYAYPVIVSLWPNPRILIRTQPKCVICFQPECSFSLITNFTAR